jgi:hypothetical protein
MWLSEGFLLKSRGMLFHFLHDLIRRGESFQHLNTMWKTDSEKSSELFTIGEELLTANEPH